MHPIHPMVVHFPIALLLASTLFDALACRWRREQFRHTSVSLLVLGVLAAGVAVLTGHVAEDAVERSGIPKQAIEIHEELGDSVFWVFLGLLSLRLVSYWGFMRERPALVLVLGCAGRCCCWSPLILAGIWSIATELESCHDEYQRCHPSNRHGLAHIHGVACGLCR
jgi:uncharacterized membrane protein